jgi:beta-phosphoglucomutase-like phosphatase (HAD superfamily)
MHAIVFDIDGTLLQSSVIDEALYRESVEAILGRVHFRESLNEYKYVTDSGILLQVFEDNGIRTDIGLNEQIQQQFYQRVKSYIVEHGPFPEVAGAKDLVRRVRMSEDHVAAIATGGWRATAKLKLTTAGFDLDGVPLASSDDALDRREIMRHALKPLGDDFESVVYFGDAVWDQAACESLGWRFQAVGAELDGLRSYDGVQIG